MKAGSFALGAITVLMFAAGAPAQPYPSPGPPSLIAGPSGTPTAPAPLNLDAVMPWVERAGWLDLTAPPFPPPLSPLDHGPFSHDCTEPASLDRPAPPDSIDVRHYEIDILHLDEATAEYRAVTTVTLVPRHSLVSLTLDLASAVVTEVEVAPSLNGEFASVNFSQTAAVLTVVPPAPLRKDLPVRVRVHYQSDDPECVSVGGLRAGMVFDTYGVHTFSEPSYARHWFPSHDVPWDRATFRLTVTVPPGREASATGRLVADRQENGTRRMTWVIADPMPTYLAAFYVGDFVELRDQSPGGIPLQYFTQPNRVEQTRSDFVNLPDMMEFYSGIYPYPYHRYAMTMAGFPGGMEHVTNSLIRAETVNGTRQFEPLFAHELAHQWWGDLVTMNSWREIWLNEGFATYFDRLYTEHRYGWEAMLERKTFIDAFYINEVIPRGIDHPILDPPKDGLFSFVVYNKGARVLDMLRGVSRLRLMQGRRAPPAAFHADALAGDARFFAIFARYAAAHAYRSATTSDFQRAAEQELGENLGWFFDPWLHGTAYPQLALDWRRRVDPPAGVRLTVRVRQTQGGVRYTMPLHVRYVAADGRMLDEVRRLHPGDTHWSVELPAGEWEVRLDPDHWLLHTAQRTPLFSRLASLRSWPNPFSGAVQIQGLLSGAVAERGRLEIFDAQGRAVHAQDLGELLPEQPFTCTWDGRTPTGLLAPAGLYFARLRVGLETRGLRLVVVR